jgi:hypothetical protein
MLTVMLLWLAITPCARAEITIDVSKMTCKEFMFDNLILPDNVAYWLSGFYNGMHGNTKFNIDELQDYVNKVEQYCMREPGKTVMQAAETVLSGEAQRSGSN